VLHVAVHYDYPIAFAVVEASGDAVMLPEVPRELDALEPLVLFLKLPDYLPRAVAAAVLDHYYLKVVGYGLKRGFEPAVELLKEVPGLVNGYDYGDMRHSGSLR